MREFAPNQMTKGTFFLEIDFLIYLISDPESEEIYGKGHYQSFADIKQRSKFVYISHDGLAKEYVIFPPKLSLVVAMKGNIF